MMCTIISSSLWPSELFGLNPLIISLTQLIHERLHETFVRKKASLDTLAVVRIAC